MRPLLLAAAALAAVLDLPPVPAQAAKHQPKPAREAAGKPARVSPAARAVTAFRQENGLGQVADDPALQRAAQRQADAMASAGVMSHSVAGDFSERLRQAGIRASTAAENVAMGQRSLAEVMADWKASSGHRANMLMGSATRIGVASRAGTGGRMYWAMVLAAPEPAAAPGQPGGFSWGGPFLLLP